MDSIKKLQDELKEHQFRNLHIPKLILNLIQSGKWKFRDPAPKKLEPKEFHYFPHFVEEVRPWGLQTSFKEIESICAGFNEVEIELGKQKSIQLELDVEVKRIRKTEKQNNLELLERERPHLFKKVISGELSTYKAMIEGGFKIQRVKLKKTPESFGKYIMSNFSKKQRDELLKLLNE